MWGIEDYIVSVVSYDKHPLTFILPLHKYTLQGMKAFFISQKSTSHLDVSVGNI